MKPYITRIAPSPTGDMHIGTIRTAYFNYLASKASGGKFILRIDDTDTSRSQDAFVDVIYDTMKWLGLSFDQTFKQSSRFDRYLFVANKLVDWGYAKADGDAILLKHYLGDDHSYCPDTWTDNIAGEITVTDHDRKVAENLVLIKSDKTPSYHFASVVDDIDSGVNYVIRGVDHINNTPKQIAIYKAISMIHIVDIPEFAHIGLIHKDGKKLSKRDGAASALALKSADYHPDAVLNFILRMGWGPTVDDKTTAIITKDNAVDLFFKGSMKSAKSNFDQMKLDSFDRKYKAKT